MSNGRGSKEERNKRFQKSKLELIFDKRGNKSINQKDLNKMLGASGKVLQETLTKAGKNMGDLFKELEAGTKESKENGAGFKDAFMRPNILQQLPKDRIQPPKPKPFGDDGTKPVLDSKGNIVKNLRQKALRGGQFQDVDVVDLTTEVVIDE